MTGLEPGIQGGGLPLTNHRGSLADQRRYLPLLFMLLEAFPERLLVCRTLVFSLQDEPGELACLGEL
jgi:hypothetical protein